MSYLGTQLRAIGMCDSLIISNLRLDIFEITSENSSNLKFAFPKLKSDFPYLMTMAWIAFVAYDFKSKHSRFTQANDKNIRITTVKP